MKRSKIKTADGYCFKKGKTYYRIAYGHTSQAEVQRLRVTSVHRYGVSCQNLSCGGSDYISCNHIHPSNVYRQYKNTATKVWASLLAAEKALSSRKRAFAKQSKKYGFDINK